MHSEYEYREWWRLLNEQRRLHKNPAAFDDPTLQSAIINEKIQNIRNSDPLTHELKQIGGALYAARTTQKLLIQDYAHAANIGFLPINRKTASNIECGNGGNIASLVTMLATLGLKMDFK